MVIIEQGKCNLYGFLESKDDKDDIKKILVVRLPEQSWFGDF